MRLVLVSAAHELLWLSALSGLVYSVLQWIRRPSEFLRPVKRMLPASAKADTKPLSGWICEDVWHHVETFGLLSVLPFAFTDGEVGFALEAGRMENNMQAAVVMPVLRHIWLRLASATIFVLRFGAEVGCTLEESNAQPGLLDTVNAEIREARRCYKADMAVVARLTERHLPKDALSTNLHAGMERLPQEMDECGHPKPELGIERKVRS